MEILTRAALQTVPRVRLVGEGSNEIVPTETALRLAYDQGLDLVVVSDKSDPPVVRIQDYKKLLYEKKKEKKKHVHQPETKEIQLKLNITDHDLETKLNMMRKFLARGDKVKLTLKLKGREREMPARTRQLIQKVVDALGCKASAAGPGTTILESAER